VPSPGDSAIADAGADHDLVAVNIVAGAQHLDQPVGEVAGLVRRDVGGQHDCEFVAAETGDEVVAPDLGAQPLGHQLQQAVAHRVAKTVVDVLEQIEIDVEHRHIPVGGLAALERLAQPFPEQIPVRQIGQAVMMGHMRDPRLGLAALGDIDNGHQIAVAAVKGDAASEGEHVDFAAVRLYVPPVAGGMIDVAEFAQRLAVRRPFVLRPDLVQLHAQEFFAGIAIMLDRGVVDTEEVHRISVKHPHRHRVVVEQQAEGEFALLQRGDVGHRQRQHVAECGGGQSQAAVAALDLELGAAAAFDDAAQPLDHGRRAQKISAGAEPAPQQFGCVLPEQPRRALVEMDNLEIGRTAGRIANGGKRQHAFVGCGKNRVEEIVLGIAFVHVSADQRAAPARNRRQCQHVIGPHQPVADAMSGSKIGTAVLQRARDRFAERGGAIRRQRV
jgi:hypothetical protein